MAKQLPVVDTRQRVLDLRVQAAEANVEAAKLHCRVTHMETVAAKLLLRRLELQDEAAMLTDKGKLHYSKMKEHMEVLSKRQELKDQLEPEIARRRDKAVKYASQASGREKRMAETEERARTAIAEADRLRRERDKLLIQAKRFEAEAIRAGGQA